MEGVLKTGELEDARLWPREFVSPGRQGGRKAGTLGMDRTGPGDSPDVGTKGASWIPASSDFQGPQEVL